MTAGATDAGKVIAPDAPTETVIAASGLRRRYGRGAAAFEAVRGVDLRVDAGEVFALLGTNGAGKTSTLDLLEGLAAPDAGTVAVFGRDPRRDRKLVRPDCGIMLQSGGLPADLTVEETLAMWRGTCSHPTTVDAVLTRVNLAHRAAVRVGSLSGGEQRRVDLACALLGRPRLLFLDEPTTGLDPQSRHATWQLLAELKESGVTIVLTTHYLDEAEALADRIAIMDRGTIARTGTLAEIVRDHPASITFDHPGVPLPELPGARVEAGPLVRVHSRHLQADLLTLLTWAERERLPLPRLQAKEASLESVFLSIAEEPSPPQAAEVTDPPTGAHR